MRNSGARVPALTRLVVLLAALAVGAAGRPEEHKRNPLDQGAPAARPVTAWPDATNTGVPAGTQLATVNGNLTIKTAGTVIDSQFIQGCVAVSAPGVIIRRSRIRCTSSYAVLSSGYTGERLLIEDSEIDCLASDGRATRTTAIGDNNFTARWLNIHGCENGFDVDDDVTIQDSWIHDLLDDPVNAHTDGIQIAIGRNRSEERRVGKASRCE